MAVQSQSIEIRKLTGSHFSLYAVFTFIFNVLWSQGTMKSTMRNPNEISSFVQILKWFPIRCIHCFCFIILCFVFGACETKTNPVYELLLFREEVKNNSAEYSQADWEIAIAKYAEISQRLDQMQFTEEEYLEIDKIKGEIVGYATSTVAQKVSDRILNIQSEVESFANGFCKAFQLPQKRK